MENKEIVMRIKLLIEHKNVSPSKFAKMISFNQSNLSKVLKEDRKVPTNLIKAICESLDVPYSWLVNGEGPMFHNRIIGNTQKLKDNNQSIIAGGSVINSNNRTIERRNTSNAKAVMPYLREELVNVPYVPINAKASFVESLYDTAYETETYGVMTEEGEKLNESEYKVFQIDGDSMTPNIPDRSKVLAKLIPEERWENASGVVFVVYGKTLTIKRILKNSLFDKNILTLKADNPVYGQVDIENNEIRGMWQAIRIVSQRIV
jgi:hypothetical protein